jgi:hypothetical protein
MGSELAQCPDPVSTFQATQTCFLERLTRVIPAPAADSGLAQIPVADAFSLFQQLFQQLYTLCIC